MIVILVYIRLVYIHTNVKTQREKIKKQNATHAPEK